MANPSKRKGTSWENRVRDFWRWQGVVNCERMAQNGKNDRGDLTGFGPGITVECKNTREFSPAKWMDELEAEMRNAKSDIGWVQFPRRGRPTQYGPCLIAPEVLALLLREAGRIPDREETA